jgi:hypothetical protein
VSRGSTAKAAILSVAMLSLVVARAQSPLDTFTATASVKSESARASADVVVSVTQYASDAERAGVMKALREGGTPGAQKALAAMRDAGFIQLGERRVPLKLAIKQPSATGHLVTVVTSQPILFIGGGIPDAQPRAGFDVAIAIFEVVTGEGGVGELAPAAKLGVNATGALLIDDYGGPVLWLNRIARAK